MTGLAKLAAAARSRVLASNACVARGPRKLLAEGTRPTAENLAHFALTPAGLAVGFKAGQVAGQACGRVEATVPYATLAPSLGPLGKRLVAGVRAPRR